MEQRKHAEALNEKLHEQLIEAQTLVQASNNQAANSDGKAAVDVISVPDFTLVSKEQLHRLLLEYSHNETRTNVFGQNLQMFFSHRVSEHPDRVCTSHSSALLTQNTNQNRSSKSTIGYSSSSNRSVRKAKSEQRTGVSGEPSKASKSECQIRNLERPKVSCR